MESGEVVSDNVIQAVVRRGASLNMRVPGAIFRVATSAFPFPGMVSSFQKVFCEGVAPVLLSVAIPVAVDDTDQVVLLGAIVIVMLERCSICDIQFWRTQSAAHLSIWEVISD
jgi:hypothetical protein